MKKREKQRLIELRKNFRKEVMSKEGSKIVEKAFRDRLKEL